ncbi:mandelate racemase/muconate lactonizing enzyme family protein [Salipiger mucosus]|uniref:Galactonate dehydratase n=1 Tax=Salipiger mucosus DSM 16094 TaxID=1123237 RepID=S9QZY8_9RHOB|nr:mandelate racemase/muconate lactonizing enzyme family protein [Salipiger mucosus]EPX85248.1 Galactonate dehydratase [Salipiger mucosus DSM 16094]
MKITAIKSYPVRVGLRNQLLVKVETDEGLSGWGESGLSYREKAVMGAIEHYTQFLLGRDPMNAGALWQEMYRSQYFEGGRVLSAAIAALDIAFHDIRGKALGVPVHQLLGGAQRQSVPTFATTAAEPGEEMIAQAKQLIDAGWSCIRLMAAGQENPELFEPRESIAETAEWVTRVREELGPEPVLGVEYHHRLSVAEAAAFCQKLPRGTIDFLEEPIRDETASAYEALRRMTEIPFAIGEEFSSKWQFLPYLEGDILQYARIDICNVGGFTEAMKVAGWAEAHYLDLMPHNPLGPICTAASVHLAAAVPNFAWLECRSTPVEQHLGFDDRAFFPVQLELDGAAYPVPDTPGLGVEVDEARLEAAVFDYSEPPHLRRRDGAFTNW